MVKNLPANAEELGSIPGSGRSPGEGNGKPLQYSCLENPMDGGAWWNTVHGTTKCFHFHNTILIILSGGSDGKESACNVGDPGSIPGLGRSPGKGNGNLLQYTCMENPMGRGVWLAI